MYGELKQELKVEVGIVDSPHAYIIRDKVSGVATKRRDDTLKYDDFHVEDSRTKQMPSSKNDEMMHIICAGHNTREIADKYGKRLFLRHTTVPIKVCGGGNSSE